MPKEQEEIGSNKTLHLSIKSKMYTHVQEMAEHYAISEPEMIRTAVLRMYNEIYRKEAFGYQSGVSDRPLTKKPVGPKISDREQMVFALDKMTNDEVTEWLRTSDFMKKHEKEKFDWICRTSEITGEREIYFMQKGLGPGSKNEGTLFDWPRFISEVRKWYKDEAKATKISSQ